MSIQLEKKIIELIETEFWESNLNSDSDIFSQVGIDGDDCDEFLQKFSEKYGVDMSDFLWYFHYQDEASITFNLGSRFFKTPNQRVQEIPITPKMLAEFATTKKWKINYPEHKLAAYRYDMIFNWVFIFSFIFFLFFIKSK
jgi:hypothetical protein